MIKPTPLAVIVPTMNRPAFLSRTVRWYARHGIPLYIGDSSATAQSLAHEATRKTHYFWIPGANETEASLQVALLSDAPYLAWAGDDDFLIPGALHAAVAILDNQRPYTSVYGESVIMATRKNAVYGAPESTVRYTEKDAFFRVYRREILIEGFRVAASGESYDSRGRILERELLRSDNLRHRLPLLMLVRQVHPWRVTASKVEPWRARLGHCFPRIQYAKQWLESWRKDNRLSLPSLRRRSSPFHEAFSEVTDFLTKG